MEHRNFWILFTGFLIFMGFYFLDFYVLKWFQIYDPMTNTYVDNLTFLFGMFGLAFGFYLIHSLGYVEGAKEGYEDGLREGYDKALNGS